MLDQDRDFAHLTGRRLALPTGGLDIRHQDATQSARHLPSPQAHLPVVVAGLGLGLALGQEVAERKLDGPISALLFGFAKSPSRFPPGKPQLM